MAKLRMFSRPKPVLKSFLIWSVLTEVILYFTPFFKQNVVTDLLLRGIHLQLSFLKLFFICYERLLPNVPEHAELTQQIAI